MPKSIQKNIRVTPEQWKRIKKAAWERDISPNRFIISLAMAALDRSEWPSTETEIRVARACLFAAQAIARDLVASGREKEVGEIRDFITTIVPDPEVAPAMESEKEPKHAGPGSG